MKKIEFPFFTFYSDIGWIKMSRKRIINALKVLGLSNIDTGVYVLLAKDGPHKIEEIASVLNQPKRNIRRSLRDLQNTKIVETSIEYPLEFIAVPFEEVIKLMIDIKKEQAEALQASKEELLSTWRSITNKDNEKS
jgi:sugar-specific transcriptional regulator TrmB